MRRNIWASAGSLGAIAAAIAVVALIVTLLALWRENRATKSELARLSSQVQAAEAQLATERETVQFLGTPGAQMVELTGTSVAPGAHAMVAYDRNGRAMLLARGLPSTPAGKVYQLWFIVGKQKIPGRVFTTDTSGNGNLKDEIPAVAQGAPVFAVTLEPAGGVSSPTGAIFLISGS